LRDAFASDWLQEGVKLVRKAIKALMAIGIQVAIDAFWGRVMGGIALFPRWMPFRRIVLARLKCPSARCHVPADPVMGIGVTKGFGRIDFLRLCR
jgi:hypothetical protein